MIGWLKAAFSAIGAVFGWLRDRQLINAGKDAANGQAAQKTLEQVAKAADPHTPDELDRVQSRYRRD